jgi:hypothetical protein
MSLKGARAEVLLTEVLARLEPFLPRHVRVEIHVGRLIQISAHTDHSHGGLAAIGSLGWTLSPWLPRSVAARVAAHDAAEHIIDAVFGPPRDCGVRTSIVDDQVHLQVQLPDQTGSTRSVELAPLPIERCV